MSTIIFRNSTTPGSIPDPAQLQFGEIVLNVADGKLYFKKQDGTLVVIQ